MKIATQLLMIAATAGLAVFAVNTRKPTVTPEKEDAAPVQAETDAWFI